MLNMSSWYKPRLTFTAVRLEGTHYSHLPPGKIEAIFVLLVLRNDRKCKYISKFHNIIPEQGQLPLQLFLSDWCCICCYCNLLTLTSNVRGPSYLGLTGSISWLLMPWLLTSPGHQQPWYWLCRICKSWSYLRKDLKYLCHINVE